LLASDSCLLVSLYQVLYDDGDEEILNFKEEKWEIVEADADPDVVGFSPFNFTCKNFFHVYNNNSNFFS